ncbi:MAG: hypothetical protein FJX23_00930 [Alphaproteobacteria bacterium]|nr:hypothetical protein [Alphaproteobacteria bacterium]
MGQEINTTVFVESDFDRFAELMRQETKVLEQWFREERFSAGVRMCGLELEAWLADERFSPAPKNAEFLEKLNHPLVGAELAKFNFELNTSPRKLGEDSNALSRLHTEVSDIWEACFKQAKAQGLHALTIGVMPTLEEGMLNVENMTVSKRYEALNQQLFNSRAHVPLSFHIDEGEGIHIEQPDMMLEAASTSLQVHLKVGQEEAVRCYNASIIASAPLVAASANSPYLYGRALWDESRIAIFERSVPSGHLRDENGRELRRAGFGTGYAKESLFEPFAENIALYPPILPEIQWDATEPLPHVRLHNGTVWRWNRPILGFDGGDPEKPHLRIEHRTMSAGPSLMDVVANAAYYLGLTFELMNQPTPPEQYLPFEVARENFYNAAKFGLDANIRASDGSLNNMRQFSLDVLLPLARKGLVRLGIKESEIEIYLDGVIEPRLRSGQNGANWQKSFVARYGSDMRVMVREYTAMQESNLPVHSWEL